MVDPDEFLAPPEGDLVALTRRLAAAGAEAAWGVMIDMYPRSVADILKPSGDFALDAGWYFDARPHLRPAPGRAVPKTVYPGSVARLFCDWGVLPQGGWNKRLRRRLTGYRYATHSMIHKTPLVFWREGDMFRNCHLTSKPVDPDRVLPIMHFKFTADLGRKIAYALETGGYNQGSRSYGLYAELIARMARAEGSFLHPGSRRYRTPEDFVRAGIAR
jgi:hypothetical protein